MGTLYAATPRQCDLGSLDFVYVLQGVLKLTMSSYRHLAEGKGRMVNQNQT